MYCPNCGCENNKNQNFCRFCGLNLNETGKSLKLQLSFGEKATALKKSDKLKRSINQLSDALIFMFFVGLFLFFFVDTTYIAAFFKYSAGIFFFFQIIKWFINYFQQGKIGEIMTGKKNSISVEREEFGSKETSKLLEEKHFEPIMGVRESSTELLYAKNKTRNFE